MFTLHHGFWLYFFTRHHKKVWQFVLGAMLPDYVYIAVILLMLVKGQLGWQELTQLSPRWMMAFLPMYPWAVEIDLIGHSVFGWGTGFLSSFLPGLQRLRPFMVGWGTHLLIDELTHAAYANHFFYPFSLYDIHSTISYWEENYFAREFKLVNMVLMGVVSIYLVYQWWKKKRRNGE